MRIVWIHEIIFRLVGPMRLIFTRKLSHDLAHGLACFFHFFRLERHCADHGVPAELIQRAEEKSRAFFALPEAVKRQYLIEGGGGQRGYTAFGIAHKSSRCCACAAPAPTDSILLRSLCVVSRV